ncbi:helix-turn-helix transcriptional regulator [Paenibacillus sp. 2TAB23]|uniref:helix-turn-helix transcriptional regulator n=1 Tax=Paenibacillus sp. 2TAB23 TaxID=3233004 RepID=UPI003F9B95E1
MSADPTPANVLSGFKLKEFTSSLFIRLLIGFLIVIALLVSFIWYSVVYYRGNLKEEVINHNTVSLQKTTENYERLIESIHHSVLTFSLEIQSMQSATVDYTKAVSTMEEIQMFLLNRSLYLDNLFLMNESSGFVLEKGRGADTETMFDRFYKSEDYDVSFWEEQHKQPYTFKLLAESSFVEINGTVRTVTSQLLPIVVKNDGIPGFYMLAMANADRIYDELGQTIDGLFYILNEQGQPIYTSAKSSDIQFPAFTDTSGFVMKDSDYYFYNRASNGLTFVHVLPDKTILMQIRWNFSFVLLLVLSIAISVVVSFLISVRLNTPVKRIIEAIAKWNTPQPWESGIKEFNIIHTKISDILQTSRNIHQDMSEKESLLQYYAYSNALKKIRHQHKSSSAWITEDRPFVLLLFEVTCKSELSLLDVNEERATSFIREYIGRIIVQTYADAVTFQMEKDQILSIVFTEIDDPDIRLTLEHIQHMLKAERDYCFLTMTASGGSRDWNEAYRIGIERLKLRAFNAETQIVEAMGEPGEDSLSPAQEEELDANLSSGNDAFALTLVRRILGKMNKRSQSAQSVLRFAENVILRTHRILMQRQIDPSPARIALTKLPFCYTYEHLDELITTLITNSAQLVKDIKEKRDPFIQFVYDYMEQHYDKDVNLDAMADKLNISRSYLSRYFKEKTGEYFVDYVNSVRINKAKALLLKPDMLIQEVAQFVGYQNINSFNRMFKKFTGFTPSEFRKNELR